jgi:hypothetical protein
MTSPPPSIPREPEIELLGRIARRALGAIRVALWLAGAVAVTLAIHRALGAPNTNLFAFVRAFELQPADRPPAWSAAGCVWGAVWLCAGLPLLAPVDWLFGRGRWIALAIGAVLWAAPALLPDDHTYGFVLRFFASLVACATLAVWRTVRSLAAPAPAAG